jgi:histidine triad (HIT) family protein
MVVLGMEVPHAHIHLIPLNKEADVNFTNPKLKVEPIEMQDIANKIKANLS